MPSLEQKPAEIVAVVDGNVQDPRKIKGYAGLQLYQFNGERQRFSQIDTRLLFDIERAASLRFRILGLIEIVSEINVTTVSGKISKKFF